MSQGKEQLEKFGMEVLTILNLSKQFLSKLEGVFLMTETLETLAKRVNQLEKVVAEMTLLLSGLVDTSKPTNPENHKTADKQYEAQAIQKMREHLGIADIELMPLEELRKSMARHGIRAEDNEFSRAIIEEREK